MKKFIFALGFFTLFIFTFSLSSALTATVCCEKTKLGAFCQNAPAEQCDSAFQQVQTSCDSTSFCKAGTCYDSSEGTCLDNTPQRVCNANGGVWSAEAPAQCNLGCCVLGDQAAFVSLVRCKRLSSFLGLQTNFNSGIGNEVSCIASVQAQDKGACVYEFEFEKTCKFTTRAECSASTGTSNGTTSGGNFYKDKLCSAEELGTICGPSQKTTCAPGKDEVYFVDTCGNPANIYDSSKASDKEYWTNVKQKSESCAPNSANAGSSSCGNCNYLLGSFCRSESASNGRARIGNNICADLNCVDENNVERKHGESWCLNDDKQTGKAANSVGSRFFRRICMNGEVVTEPCGDFRAQECVQDEIETSLGKFSQSACRVNRWQDCLAQTEKLDCENTDRRDCIWKAGLELANETINGVCVPANTPGLNFWNSEETKTICGQGNKACVVTYEKGLFGGEECVDNCECLETGWEQNYANLCSSLGDCGPKLNWAGSKGFKEGYKKQIGGEKLLKELGLAEE
ncbi:MAG: hypothetical protein AABW79_04625 [Nanoarchaeota archaeon]